MDGKREGGRRGLEREREGERERERGTVIMGMVESFREKEGKEQKKNGKKNAICLKICPSYTCTVWVAKKFPFFIKQRPCNGNFAFRFRVRSVVKVSVFFCVFLRGNFRNVQR